MIYTNTIYVCTFGYDGYWLECLFAKKNKVFGRTAICDHVAAE